jgi:hypothetical protein
MPKLARRLSNSSQEAFEEFCKENQPLSRRLSHGADTDTASSRGSFAKLPRSIKKEILLPKRHSMTSVAAGNKEHSQPSRSTRRSTRVTGAPLGKASTPAAGTPPPKAAKSRTVNSVNRNKDNGHSDEDNVMQSPTPYWKVAKDRGGIHSPPVTRAAKKQKTGRALNFDTIDGPQKQDGLMVFSPPDQVANAKREKMERERKTKEWYVQRRLIG